MIAVGIDISKAKSTVAVIDSDGTVLASPFTISYTAGDGSFRDLSEGTWRTHDHPHGVHWPLPFVEPSIPYFSTKEHSYIREPDRFTAYRIPICKSPMRDTLTVQTWDLKFPWLIRVPVTDPGRRLPCHLSKAVL